MSEKFIKGLQTETNITLTENGALAYATTNSALLDYFAQGGALRSRPIEDVLRLFSQAFAENPLLATRAMFYFRDVRGGQGERETFRQQLKWLASFYPEVVKRNLKLIPYYGRWDDLYALFDTDLEKDVIKLFAKQLTEDLNSEHPSLLAKWLKSENTSSKQSRILARKTRERLNFSPKQYRKTLSYLRKKLDIVEQKISSNRWSEIKYEAVPSQANIKYANAFLRHDRERRDEYLQSLASKNTKINADVLFPYEIIRRIRQLPATPSKSDIVLYDSLWNSLPDYFNGKHVNAIAVVDVSGSMYSNRGLPLDTAISVGIYLAERNTHPAFHNKFITFSEKPQLVEIKGKSVVEKVKNLRDADWGLNTNIQAVFNLILQTALKENLTQEDLPQRLYIISDMEFDSAIDDDENDINKTLFEVIAYKFQQHGYQLPKLIFWNVNARNKQFPMSLDQRGFQLISGCNPSIFKHALEDTFLSPEENMLGVLNSERYQLITI